MSEITPTKFPMCDFERIRYELRPGDVILVEGRSRISSMIRYLTQSSWAHAALYIGKIYDVDDLETREHIKKHSRFAPDDDLIIDGYLGKGFIVSSLKEYSKDHIRICRPHGIAREDAQKVVITASKYLGTDYGTRHFFDLTRFFLPWRILPRRWFSSLFNIENKTVKLVCSSMIAESFQSVGFPLLPSIAEIEAVKLNNPNLAQFKYIKINPNIFVPADFDYSPYFDIIKYPFSFGDYGKYQKIEWDNSKICLDNKTEIVNTKKDNV